MIGTRKIVYPDTVVWNCLFDEATDPARLRAQLHEHGLDLAYSSHVLYELSRTFRGTRPSSQQRATELFLRFKSFVEQDFPYLRQNVSVLLDESEAADGNISGVQPFGGTEYSLFRSRVERLSSGNFDSQTDFAVTYRNSQVQELRSSIKQGEYTKLTELAGMTLSKFIEAAGRTHSRNILKAHLAGVREGALGSDLTRLAKRILRTRSYRVSHAFVWTDLFLTWRKERNGALRRDAADDCYHLVNASYCDIYGTCDEDQKAYAPTVLPHVKFAHYDRTKSVTEWLCSLS